MDRIVLVCNACDGETEGIFSTEEAFVGFLESRGMTFEVEVRDKYNFYEVFKNNKKTSEFIVCVEVLNKPTSTSYLSRI